MFDCWFSINSGVRQCCKIAPDLFTIPMDYIMERTVHRGFVGASQGEESFADDDAPLAETLEILVLCLGILDKEGRQFGLEINWNEAIIQSTDKYTVI